MQTERPFAAADRREFLKQAALAGWGALSGAMLAGCSAGTSREMTRAAPSLPFAAPRLERVRLGIVGVGGMGTNHVNQLLHIDGVEIRAVCDIVVAHAQRAQKIVQEAGQPEPRSYTRGPRDFERMCDAEELDIVYTATPWEWHVPVCLAALRTGKHAATEVPAATSVEDCWALVEAAEKHQRHCVMLENCCYDRHELMLLNMVRQGLLGEVLHGECGYLHDLREVKFSRQGEGLWRREWAKRHDANLYPTHGLGPVANCMDINRGDRFEYLVSMSSPSRGLQLYAQKLPPDDPRRNEQFKLGDVNTTLIRTARGRTITVVHDTNLPRPYSRINMIQGTRGLFMDYPPRIHVEGRSPAHTFEEPEKYAAEFEHPLWKSEAVKKAGGGHGGMDYLESYRLMKCLREGLPTDMNVYDAAALSCLVELTERSIAARSKSVDIPDFTRGRWQNSPRLEIVEA